MDSKDITQDRDGWWGLENAYMNFGFREMWEIS